MTDALKLTTYFGERDRTDGRLLADALLDVYAGAGIRASLLLRGAAGFGRIHHLHTDRLLSQSLSGDLPVVSIAVDLPDRIQAAVEQVLAIKRRGLITLDRARLVSSDPDSGGLATRAATLGRLEPQTKLTILLGRRDRAGGQPAFIGVCDLLQQRGTAGATVLLGVDGTRDGRRTRARFFDHNSTVPLIVVAVGGSRGIAELLPGVRRLVPDSLGWLEDVRVCKRDGVLLARPHDLPDTDPTGRKVWQKLTLYASESATYDGRTLHLEVIRRLRRSTAAGATSLRGIWGFHGDHAPHGDRLLQLRRRVPVVTTVIDSPSRIARSFEIVDELTRRTGLVTSQALPGMLAISAPQRIGDLRLGRPPE